MRSKIGYEVRESGGGSSCLGHVDLLSAMKVFDAMCDAFPSARVELLHDGAVVAGLGAACPCCRAAGRGRLECASVGAEEWQVDEVISRPAPVLAYGRVGGGK